MQWMSVGSGVMHAEGGGNDVGVLQQGFQIWINVPSGNKMDDPEYGTISNGAIPKLNIGTNGSSRARVLAGATKSSYFGLYAAKTYGPNQYYVGPFTTKADIQMIDFEIASNDKIHFEIAQGLDTAILYVYEGDLSSLNGEVQSLKEGSIVVFDASEDPISKRSFTVTTPFNIHSSIPRIDDNKEKKKTGVMLFAGTKLKEPIAWHGPIVMNTQEQIQQTFAEMRSGNFPPKRVSWDYKEWKSRPKGVEMEHHTNNDDDSEEKKAEGDKEL